MQFRMRNKFEPDEIIDKERVVEENEEFKKAFDEAVEMAIETELVNKYRI